jgi:predicted DNA-binding antitoxin AbrB/MazE fold protein
VDTLRIEAVYEHGTLKLPHELPLQEGQRVTITIMPLPGSAVERLSRMVPWTGDPEELHRFLNDSDEGLWREP